MRPEKIFGVGFSKTGTTSLEKALEILGYKVCRGHWKSCHTFYLHALWIHKDYDEIFRLVNYWDAFADAPWGGTELYKELYKRRPSSKFILTVRNPEKWYMSFENMITMFDLNHETALESYHAKRYGSAYFFKHIFNIEKLAGNKQKIIEHFRLYNQKVIDFFYSHPANFMVYDITSGEGWPKLCKFLNVKIPEHDFPHANKSIDNSYLSDIVSQKQNCQAPPNNSQAKVEKASTIKSKPKHSKNSKAKPRISVVILSYNFEKYLPECIDSILAQTLKPYEIILCDDCSNDNSWGIIKSYQNKFSDIIRSYRHQENMGPFYNGTFGGKVYKGDLLCIVDGDDRWLPQKLEKEWNALQNNPSAQISYSNVNLIDENGNYIKSWYEGKGRTPPSGDLLVDVLSKCFFPNTRSIFRNELVTHHAFQEEGHCDERLESYWDWERKIRYAARFSIVYSGETLVEYRKHDAGFSTNSPDIHFEAFVQVYQKHLPLLKRKPFSESIYVKANLETRIAKMQERLYKAGKVDYYNHRNVYRRNQSSLKKISNKDDQEVKKELSQLLSNFITKSIKNDMRKGNRNEALKSWFFFFMNNIKNPLSYKLLKKIIVTKKSNK